MIYDFDRIPDRRNTDCEKYDRRQAIFGRKDVIPLWVADTDFEAAPFITQALEQRLRHPVLAYSFRNDRFFDAVIGWAKRRHGWTVERDWIDFSPGVVTGLVFAMQAFSESGDGVVIQPPVYPPFARMTRLNERQVLNNPLVWNGEKYVIDFDDLDRKLADAKIFLMSNPHNPTGRVFTRAELEQIGELCAKHDVFIISDEIHGDLVQRPYQHIPIASLSPEIARRTLTLFAPSKTFNIAGLSTSVAVTPDPAVRRRFRETLKRFHLDQGNIFGTVALEAAYTHGDQWLDQLNAYIGQNARFVLDFLQTHLPSVKTFLPEGTFLIWLDFRAWGMPHDEVFRFLVDEAGLGLNDGKHFGEEGIGFMRLNIGTSRAVLRQALEQLLAACRKRGLA